jgi:hypothetical protein
MKIFYILSLFLSLLSALSINEQIRSLEGATPKERVALMNHIKEQLIEMNQNERMDTIHLLKSQFHSERGVEGRNHESLSQEHFTQEQSLHDHQLHQHHILLEEGKEEREHQRLDILEPHHNEEEQ